MSTGTERPGRGRWWRRAGRIVVPSWRTAAVVAAVAIGVAWLLWQTCGLSGCPAVARLSAYQPGGASVLLDRSGEAFARLRPVSRELVPLDSLPSYVPEAFLAVEDQRFYAHGAVDWKRVAGSIVANVRAGGFAEGFSTITMQLARNVFPDRLPGSQRTLRRKLLEMRVAGEIEDRFTKDEILELYLNHIYFGGSLYGIEAASQDYFGHPAAALTLPEAATLAALPKAPNSCSPRDHFERSRARRGLVLSLMADQGRITRQEADRAQRRGVRVQPERPTPERETPVAPYFVRAVRRVLEDRLGDALYAHPLRIHTTLDRGIQRAAEASLDRQLRAVERGVAGRFRGPLYGAADAVDSTGTRYLQGAVVVLEPDSGSVRALVGGRDFDASPFDRATQARRQVGSAFKPFVFAAALRDGYVPSQELTDEPLRLELPGGEAWEPENFSGRHRGEVTLREAAVHSNNVATVRLALAVGLDDVVDAAHDAGIRGPLGELPSLALGATELSLLDLVAAYTPFTAGGMAASPRLITRVEDEDGHDVWDDPPHRHRAFDPGVAYLVTDLLRDVVDRGTGHEVRDVGFRGPAAGKTGTTNDGHDAWFIGYTPDLVAGVWLGFDHPRPIVSGASGGRLAAPVWGRLMRAVYRGRPRPSPWDRPTSVVERRIDPATGLILEEGCDPLRGRATTEVFLASDLPARVCPDAAEEPGFLSRAWDAAKGVARGVGHWIAGLFSSEQEETEQRQREQYLGRPRLPRESDAPAGTAADSAAQPLGIPLDSILADTLRLEPPELDTLPRPETIPLDTVPLDSLGVRTERPPDSLPAGRT